MKILYFSPIPYDDLKQRPQYIAEELSKMHDVWYIEPTITGMRCLKKGGTDFKAKQYDISSTLHVIRLNGLFSLHIRFQKYDKRNLNTWFERIQLKKLIQQADIIWIGYEACYRLIRPYDAESSIAAKSILIYDKMDDNVKLEQKLPIKTFLYDMRTELEEKADAILVSAKIFYESLIQKRDNVYLIPNGVSYDGIEKNQLISFEKSRRTGIPKRFGYVGLIGHWFDNDLIRLLATQLPQSDIVLVGPVAAAKVELPNVHYYGTVPKSQVYHWINSFDVCLYPFKPSELLDTIDPVKIYEYLLMNKPVIAIDSKEIRKYKEMIHIYKTPEEFINLCKTDYLSKPFLRNLDKQKFFEENSWEARGKKILKIINSL